MQLLQVRRVPAGRRRPRRARSSCCATTYGVGLSGEVYDTPLHRQPVFAPWPTARLPGAEELCARHVCLPVYAVHDRRRRRLRGRVAGRGMHVVGAESTPARRDRDHGSSRRRHRRLRFHRLARRRRARRRRARGAGARRDAAARARRRVGRGRHARSGRRSPPRVEGRRRRLPPRRDGRRQRRVRRPGRAASSVNVLGTARRARGRAREPRPAG